MSVPQASLPWYREPWPWIIMAGPVTVIIAGIITIWIAFSTFEGVVAEDYYKQGLAINQVLKREAAARQMGLSAKVSFPGGLHRISVSLEGAAPPTLQLKLIHATRSGQDMHMRLVRADGRYEGAIPRELAPGHWQIQIEDPSGQWRLAGAWKGSDAGFSIGQVPAQAR